MRRFQMMLDDELDEALERQAALEAVSKAELLRRYASERLAPLPELEDDPIWGLVDTDRTPGDTGEPVEVDEVVYGGRSS